MCRRVLKDLVRSSTSQVRCGPAPYGLKALAARGPSRCPARGGRARRAWARAGAGWRGHSAAGPDGAAASRGGAGRGRAAHVIFTTHPSSGPAAPLRPSPFHPRPISSCLGRPPPPPRQPCRYARLGRLGPALAGREEGTLGLGGQRCGESGWVVPSHAVLRAGRRAPSAPVPPVRPEVVGHPPALR